MKIFLPYLLILCLWLNPATVCAQSVGLVLSGGGARGMTHIGVIKALEENNIPIDYITGTSMGAIVGGMYAMGMTPNEMIELLKSDNFKRWSTGEVEQKYIYYYKNADPNPGFIDLRFHIKRTNGLSSISIRPVLPTNVISPVQMNYAFLELFAQVNALIDNDFDNLLVPFRSVASDIYKKEAVIFRKGDLGDAIRASMTFPFVFKPIEVDGRLLFDGGIFNNFPADVMKAEFTPDFMIGSVVASDQGKPSIDNPYQQLQTMIMGHTNYSMPEDRGILFHFDMTGYAVFDFSKVDELVELGYRHTIARIDEIKQRIERRVLQDEINERRSHFTSQFPEPKFQNIYITGIDSLQQLYVSRVFKNKHDTVFDLARFKRSYFALISDERIREIIPHARYNSETGYFDLHLRIKTEAHFKAQIGGNISSNTSNQAYIGLQYQRLSEYSHTSNLDAQFGKIYNGLGLGTRIDFPTENFLYARGNLVLHSFDYYEGNRFFYEDNRLSEFTRNETYAKLRIGLPVTMEGRAEFGVGYGKLRDRYVLNREAQVGNLATDRSTYSIGSVFTQIESHTLNKAMFPTAGYHLSTSVQGLYGTEMYRAPNSSENDFEGLGEFWWQFNARYEQYFPLSRRFILGTHGELVYSTRRFSQNYMATIIQAPMFEPTVHSRTVFNDAFSANQFAAVGVKPIFKVSNSLFLRSENYVFLPYRSIYRTDDNKAAYSEPFTSIQYMSELSLVFDIFKVASISVFVNYYSTAASQWNFGVNIGRLLFNERFLK